MTKLPHNFDRIVQDGIVALRRVEAELSARADVSFDPGPILLELRNVRGLADRLGDTSLEEWEGGWGNWFNNQDVAVLRELVSSAPSESQNEAEQGVGITRANASAFAALADFVEWYQTT